MSWLSALSAIDEAELGAQARAPRGFGSAAERKAQHAELLAGGGEQEIALVALGVDGAVERPPAASVVVAATT